MAAPSSTPARASWAARALSWFSGSSPPRDSSPEARPGASACGAPGGPPEGPPQRGSVGQRTETQQQQLQQQQQQKSAWEMLPQEGLHAAAKAAESVSGGRPPLPVASRVARGDGWGGAPPGGCVMDLKNIHKFVIELNKKAAAKQEGRPVEPLTPPGFSPSDESPYGILAFAGLPPYDPESSVAESPAMAMIREALGPANCPSIEEDCLFMTALTGACKRPKDNERYARTLTKAFSIASACMHAGRDLSLAENRAVRVAAETLLSSLAAQWRRLCNMESDEDAGEGRNFKGAFQREVQMQKAEVRDRILRRCLSMVSVCSACMNIPSVSPASLVDHLHMRATIFSFLITFCEGVASYQSEQLAEASYTAALEVAERDLPPYDVLRIEAAASYAAFLKQQKRDHRGALELARKAFRQATESMHEAKDSDFKAVAASVKMLLRLVNSWAQESSCVLISSSSPLQGMRA
ncbi:hypothetical protein Efla_004183 [Eimeria flavescens]